jgi:hypothetical protein
MTSHHCLGTPLFSRNGGLAVDTTASNVNCTSKTKVDFQFTAKCHILEYSKWLYYGIGYRDLSMLCRATCMVDSNMNTIIPE